MVFYFTLLVHSPQGQDGPFQGLLPPRPGHSGCKEISYRHGEDLSQIGWHVLSCIPRYYYEKYRKAFEADCWAKEDKGPWIGRVIVWKLQVCLHRDTLDSTSRSRGTQMDLWSASRPDLLPRVTPSALALTSQRPLPPLCATLLSEPSLPLLDLRIYGDPLP